jgi:flavodoxin
LFLGFSILNSVVVYSTKGGNTEKVAFEIAQELKCRAIKVSDEKEFSVSLAEFDLVFVGTWVRGGEPSPAMLNFLKKIDLTGYTGKFALFITWAGGGISDFLTFRRVKQLLDAKNHRLLDDYFKCLGKTFGLVARRHPDAQDLINARQWARKTCLQAEK